MIHRKLKPLATQRIFVSSWDELVYLCKKISYWLYTRKQQAGAERYLLRLQRVLRNLPDNDLAIVREEGLALLHELKGERRAATAHRMREIELMEQLKREAKTGKYTDATRAYMLRDRDDAALQKRREILKGLANSRADNVSVSLAV